jgi:peptidyl-prolyl cis-trans isomerase SurA
MNRFSANQRLSLLWGTMGLLLLGGSFASANAADNVATGNLLEFSNETKTAASPLAETPQMLAPEAEAGASATSAPITAPQPQAEASTESQPESQPEAAAFAIIAIVGDSLVSSLDVIERMRLIITTSGLHDTPEVRQNVMPQVVKQLIDERLQKQEAEQNNIRVQPGEVKTAIASIEAQNGRGEGSLKQFLKLQNIPYRSFVEQISAQLLWQKVLSTLIQPKVRVSDTELQRAAQSQRFLAHSEEYNITPLVLPVDKPELEQQIKALAEKLVAEVRAGANLEDVARQFTKAAPGSEPNFWVPLNQMDPALADAVKAAPEKGLLDPIRTRRGYQIIRINDHRNNDEVNHENPTQIIMKEVLFGLPEDAKPSQVEMTLQIAGQVALNPGTCLDEGVAGLKELDNTDIKVSFLRSTLSELPDYAQKQAESLKMGEVGEPFATPQGIRFYILCEKVEMPVVAKADEKLRDILFREKLELEATRHMRNLRRDNYIELR